MSMRSDPDCVGVVKEEQKDNESIIIMAEEKELSNLYKARTTSCSKFGQINGGEVRKAIENDQSRDRGKMPTPAFS